MISLSDRTISYNFRGNFANLTAGLTAASRGVQDFSGRLTALDRDGERMRRGLTSVGNTAGKVGLVAAAGLGVIIKASADFEQAMSNVQAATHETAGNMDLLRAAALKAGADTKFSATEAAGAVEALSKAGVSTADILGGGLSGALNLAAAGSIDVATAAEQAATAMTQFGLSGSEVPHIADLLAAGAGKAQGEVTDLGAALNQSGLIANQVGLSIEETTGTLAAFASAGLLGSDAGTSFKTMLGALTPNSAKAARTMSELGISAYDAQGKFIGMTAFADNLRESLSGMTDQQRQATLETIFGSDAVRAASVIYDQGGKGVESWISKVDDSGYAASTAAIKMDNLKGDVEQLGGSLETAFIGAGAGSQGPLRSLVQNATQAVNVFNDMPGPIKTATTGLLAITAVTGGALFFGAKVVGGIAATNTALASLGVTARITATSLATASAGIGAIAVASAGYGSDSLSVVDSFNRSRDAADSYGDSLQTVTDNLTASNVGKYAQDLGIDLNKLSADLAANGENGAYVTEVMDQLAESGHGVGAMFGGYLGGVLPFYTANAEKASSASQDLRDIIQGTSLTTDAAKSALTLFAVSGSQVDAAAKAATESLGAMAGPTLAVSENSAEAAKALEDARKAAYDVAQQFFNLGDSLDDSKVSLGGWIADLEKQAQALQNFRKNAQEAADKGLRQGLIAALQEAGPAGAMRLGQLADATEAQIGRANRAWKRGQQQIEGYVEETTSVPPAVATTVTANAGPARSVLTNVKGQMTALGKMVARVLVDANTNPASSKIAGIKRELATIPDENVNVNVRRVNVGGMGPQLRAAGGFIQGPGTGTSDSIPARLSDGEYVIKAASVAKYGVAMFDGLNAQRFADGGSVSKKVAERRTTGTLLAGDIDLDGGLKQALRGLKHDLSDLQHQVKQQTSAVDASKAAVDRETNARDALQGSFDSLSSSISSMFQSDLFGARGNAFSSNAASDPIGVLLGDIANNSEFQSLFAGLQGRGLSGGALTAAAQGGLAGLQTVSGYSQEDLARFQQLFEAREAQTGTTGQQVAQAQFGEALVLANTKADQANALLAQANAYLAALNVETKTTTKAVELVSSSTAKGHRSKPRGRK